jgi:long-subunit fatty acid transport protein
MKKLILTLFATAGLMSLTFGQYVDQALMFSQQNYGSTARSKAMGNAFGAIGGDFSSLSINPAGIGIYLRPEVTGTLNIIGINNTESTYQRMKTEDRNNSFGFRNFGYVMTNPIQGGGSGLVSFNVGLGFNKLNNFNQTMAVSAINSPHSRMDAFARNSYGIPKEKYYIENDPYRNGTPWESKLAWETYLIGLDPAKTDNSYLSILLPTELVDQNLNINREGYNNEYIASFGANINHQLYLGATIGMQDLYYNETKTYSENGEFGNFDYYNTATSRGFGYNLKLGIIFRPVPSLRLGAAIHTPTFFEIKEEYSSVMSSNLQNVSAAANGPHREESIIGDYQYKMETPMRAIGSFAWQFGKKGMISFDYEYVDYSKMKLRKGQDGYNFAFENIDMNEIYQPVSNLRFGGEIKPTDALSLRAGYELFGNPYKSVAYNSPQPNKDFSYNTINAGIGYRINNVSFDISYTLGSKTDYNYIYQLNTVGDVPGQYNDPVKYNNKNNEVVFTLGIKL